jgi:hypothetical protein
MARIRDVAVTIEATAVASSVLEMPLHETGDLLLLIFNKDSTSGGPSTPSGWSVPTAWSSNPLNSAGAANYVFAKRAASSSETLTLTYTSETSLTAVIAIKDVYGSTVDDAVVQVTKAGSDDSALPFVGGSSFTPTYLNSIIIGMLGSDTGFGPENLPGRFNSLVSADAGANSLAVGYTAAGTTSALDHPGYWGQAQDDTRYALIEIRSAADVDTHAYLDPSVTPATLLAGMVNNSSTVNRGTFKTAAPLDIATINGITLTYIAVTTNSADLGLNPFWGVLQFAATSSKTVIYGNELTFTSAEDLTAGCGVIFGTWKFAVPRDYVDCAVASYGGVLVGVADADNDVRWWQIGAQFSQTSKAAGHQNYAIEVADTSSDYYDSGGSINLAAVNDIYLVGRGYYGALTLQFSKLALLNKCLLAGGTADYPFDFSDFVTAINEGTRLPLAEAAGAAVRLWTPVQFGGGDPCYCEIELRTFQYPQKADGSKYLDFHVSNNKMGFEFYGKDRGSGDVDILHFIGCVFTAEQSYYWQFNASHDADADLDFSGTTVVGAAVTLRSTVSLSGVTFTNSSAFTQNAAVLDSCIFNNTKITSASLDDMALITNSTFISSGTGYAIEVSGSADTITFTGNQFEGYAATDGSTGNEAIYVNIASGSVTINIAGGGSTPSIRTAGATVTVVNSRVLTLSPIVTGSDVVIYEAGTTTVIESSQDIAGTSYTYDYPAADAGDDIDIGIFKAGYVPFFIRGYELSSSDASVPVSQVVDRFYIS